MANGGPQGYATIAAFEEDHELHLSVLMTHFAAHGQPYASPEALMADMLDDVIDVWLDDHISEMDSCTLDA